MTPASPFPPSFDGNPWTYGFALFSLTLVSAISLAILASYAMDGRIRREIGSALGNPVREPSLLLFSPVGLYRMIVGGFLLTIVFGALPDVLVLLAWGEGSEQMMSFLFLVDRLGDGLLLIPFMWSTVLILLAGQAVDHRLALDAIIVEIRPTWGFLRERLKMIAVVSLIAIGVTLAKSVA